MVRLRRREIASNLFLRPEKQFLHFGQRSNSVPGTYFFAFTGGDVRFLGPTTTILAVVIEL